MSQQQNGVYLAELGHLMPENKLNIIACIAENGSMNKWQISKKSSVALTVIRHHVNKLLAEGYIRQISEKEYKKRGREITYQVTAKGLLAAIFYKTSPIYQEPEHEENQICSYRKHETPVHLPDPFPLHYLGTLDMMLEKNQDWLGIDYPSLKNEVLDIARRSSIVASYSICFDYKLNLRPIGKSILNGKPVDFAYEDEFLSRFLCEPILEKWEGWEKWAHMLEEKPELKTKVIRYLGGRALAWEDKRTNVMKDLKAIRDAMAYLLRPNEHT